MQPVTTPTRPALASLARELRSAVLAEDHLRAEQLVGQYVQAVREFFESLPDDERAHSELPGIARELLSWTHDMAVIHRTMASNQLAILQKARKYATARTPGATRAAIQVRG